MADKKVDKKTPIRLDGGNYVQKNQLQASFTVESTFLVSFFCIVICYFLFCVMLQYDLVILQTNKIYMQYEQMTQSDMEEYAHMGCMIFRTERCEQKETPIKTQFEMSFCVGNSSFLFGTGNIEAQMHGEWEKMPVTEEVRLVSVCMDLLR